MVALNLAGQGLSVNSGKKHFGSFGKYGSTNRGSCGSNNAGKAGQRFLQAVAAPGSCLW